MKHPIIKISKLWILKPKKTLEVPDLSLQYCTSQIRNGMFKGELFVF